MNSGRELVFEKHIPTATAEARRQAASELRDIDAQAVVQALADELERVELGHVFQFEIVGLRQLLRKVRAQTARPAEAWHENPDVHGLMRKT